MQKYLLLLAVGLFLVTGSAFSQMTFSGYMFGDYYYNVTRDPVFNVKAPANSALSSAAPGSESMQAFQFRRIYFTMDDNISPVFAARLRFEADQSANPGVTAPAAGSSADELVSGKMAPFVKEAWVAWKEIFTGSTLTFGNQLTPGFAISEANWGFRFLEKTIMDQKGLVGAVDLGISLRGKLTSDGVLNYWLMIGNNSGSGLSTGSTNGTTPEQNKYKRYYADIQVVPDKMWMATAYVDYAAAGDIPNLAKTALVNNGTLTEAVYVGYGRSTLTSSAPTQTNVGVEGFMQQQSNGYVSSSGSLASRNVLGYWVYGVYYFIPEIAVVGRYDSFDPNTASDNAAKGDSRNYALGGLVYKPDKNIFISPNIVWESYEAPVVGPSVKASLTARLTLWYLYL
ncbi:MAG: hypothetical protein WBZ48_06520 [Bacteroidota bacterium]